MNKNNKLASPSPSRFGSYRRDKSNEGFHEDLDLRFEPWVGWDRWSSSKNLGRWISSTSKPYEPSNDHKSLTSFKSSISSLLMITTHPKSNQREREKPIHSFEPSNEHSKLLPPTSLPKKKKKNLPRFEVWKSTRWSSSTLFIPKSSNLLSSRLRRVSKQQSRDLPTFDVSRLQSRIQTRKKKKKNWILH